MTHRRQEGHAAFSLALPLPAFHASLTRRLGVAFILPEFLSALSPLLLLWSRPEQVPVSAVWLCVGLGAGWMGLTFSWHLPVHRLLAQGDASAQVMRTLLSSHATRTLVQALKCGLLLWMAARR